MNDGESAWAKQCSRVINQRDYRMPPAWASRRAESRAQPEPGHRVHASGRNRELADRIVSLLAGAREMVVLSSFLLADRGIEEAILTAAKRGVRVYVLLASEARLDIEDTDGEFERAMRDQHREMLDRLGGYALFRSAPHFHAKFVLADPGEGHGAGILLTANLTREALERNEELAVELTREEVEEAFDIARWAFWEYAEHELVDPTDRFRSVKPLGCVEHPGPLRHVLATTPESRGLRDEAFRLIGAASREIFAASFGWEKDHGIVEFLCSRAREGLPVTALARVRASQMPALLALAEAGARVLGFKWLHAKALCADGGNALVMSANLQPDGLDRGLELGVPLAGGRAGEVRRRLVEWSRAARWQLLASPTLGDIRGDALVWRGNTLDEMTVEAERRVDLGSVTAASSDRLNDARGPDLPPPGELPEPAHEIVYEWSVQPPLLAARAKPVMRPPTHGNGSPAAYDPPVFDEPGGRRVVAIASAAEMEKARQVLRDTEAAAIVVQRRDG